MARLLRGIARDRSLLDRLHQDGAPAQAEPETGGARRATPSQEQVWFFDAVSPGTGVSNIPLVARTSGQLDVVALRAAVQAVAARHETLSHGFTLVDERLTAVPATMPDGAFTEADLRCDPRAAHDLVIAEAGKPFDLATGPLWRCLVVRVADDEHLVSWVMHHIAVDGYSLRMLHRELVTAYRQLAGGAAVALGPAPIGYYDPALRRRDRVREEDLAYWQSTLADLPEPVEWSFARNRPERPTYAGDSVEFTVSDELGAAVRRFAAEVRGTPMMVQLTAFAVLVHRCSGADDFVVGVPTAGRTPHVDEDVVGYFVNMVALRLRFLAGVTGRELLDVVRETALDAYSHRESPFPRVLQAVHPERAEGLTPLYQLVFTSPPNLDTVDAGGVRFAFEEWHSGQTLFDFEIHFPEAVGGCVGFVKYRSELFDRDQIELLARQYVQILTRLVADPDRQVSEIPLLTDRQRQAVLAASAGPAVDFGAVDGVHRLIEAQVDRAPDAVAVTADGGRWTYRALDEHANRIAHRIRALGFGRGDRIGLYLERSLDLTASIVGVLKSGAAYVPLDPDHPPARSAFIVADAGVRLVLAGTPVPFTVDSVVDVTEALSGPADRVPSVSHEDDTAYVIYTSGTTGQPKGVVNSHRAIANMVRWMRSAYELDDTDVVLQKAPHSFDVSVGEFLLPLVTGARLAVARPGGHKDPAYLHALIRAEGVTTVHFVPSMLDVFAATVDVTALPSLRRVASGGEPLPATLARRLSAAGIAVHHLYGPTEAAVDVSHWRCDPDDPGPLPIGRPIANTQLYIVDCHGDLVADGMPGELCIGGTQVADGYIGQPELTAARFVANPFHSGTMYRTGDRARRRADGAIEFLGRMDRQVKVRGFRVEPAETEDCLVRSGLVRQAAVLPQDAALVAYVVPAEPAPALEAVRAHVSERLPHYQVPDTFVVLDALPTTANGKLDVRALPEPAARAAGIDGGEPETETERRIARIWTDVLAVDRVGRRDSFFALGGHSLKVIKAVLRVGAELGVEIPLRVLFEVPVLAEFAVAVDGLRKPAAPSDAAPTRSRRNVADLLDHLSQTGR